MANATAMIGMIDAIKASYALDDCICWILSAEMLGAETLSNVYCFVNRRGDGSFPFDFRMEEKYVLPFFFSSACQKKCQGEKDNAPAAAANPPGKRSAHSPSR